MTHFCPLRLLPRMLDLDEALGFYASQLGDAPSLLTVLRVLVPVVVETHVVVYVCRRMVRAGLVV